MTIGPHCESNAFLILTYPGLDCLVCDYLLVFINFDKPSIFVQLLSF